MIIKALLLLCLASAAVSRDLDSIIEDIHGTTEPIGSTTEAAVKTYDPCTTPYGGKGECVPYYKCTQKEMTDHIDIHFSVEECVSYLDVCCIASDRIELTTEPEATTEQVASEASK